MFKFLKSEKKISVHFIIFRKTVPNDSLCELVWIIKNSFQKLLFSDQAIRPNIFIDFIKYLSNEIYFFGSIIFFKKIFKNQIHFSQDSIKEYVI